jgi:diguanylate cyclase (GGDEF)-like protein
MLIDLDDFKRLNDQYGHAAGDQVLSRLAQLLNEAIRETDVLARYGGEEFVVLSSGTDLAGACVLAEKIRLSIEQSAFPIDEREHPPLVTVSIGVAQFCGCSKQLFRAADAALYRAKDQGKNCVVEAALGERSGNVAA